MYPLQGRLQAIRIRDLLLEAREVVVSEPRESQAVRTAENHSKAVGQEALQIVAFRVGTEQFGLEIHRVQEIIRDQRLTRVPNAPEFVEGVINLRGKIVPVIALRKRLGITGEAETPTPRIVVLQLKDLVVGLSVDSVPEVLRVPPDAVVPPPRLQETDRQYVSGVVRLKEQLIILLDVDRLLKAEQTASGALA
jgi:purine-binding chemotaxis protein CheW